MSYRLVSSHDFRVGFSGTFGDRGAVTYKFIVKLFVKLLRN